MDDCVFCKIVKGELPSYKIYENDDVLAFLDIHPVNIGHTLVIPKKHYKDIYETPTDIMEKIISVAKQISTSLKEELMAEGINVTMNNEIAAGQVIFHTHMHVIPRMKDDGFGLWHGKRGYDQGEAEGIAEKIKKNLN